MRLFYPVVSIYEHKGVEIPFYPNNEKRMSGLLSVDLILSCYKI